MHAALEVNLPNHASGIVITDEIVGTFSSLADVAQVDVLLTTDDGFLRKTSRRDGNPRVSVLNPVSWSKGNLPMRSLDTMTDEQFERHALDVCVARSKAAAC